MNDLSLVKECASAVIKNTQFCFKLEGAPAAVVLGLITVCGAGLGWYAIKENNVTKRTIKVNSVPVQKEEDQVAKN